ncbi:ornithine aminomutase subunit alpha [Peptoniphilus sp. KCTC 25270]|uniref:ornithine aminomutase subunit alpha n=1 Tax=Peptoniphilus sp. KCTC 25270 TaxID=2897414 RepID=UPI001E5688B7|nr:ornithine aminomutase subunit alpha [Peptoniphilus sp. KCTC 25270]MCD1147063.1 ornithine aminomutase subunit alpha [Peptoniphilus sp. KCTC 25270]
MERKDDFQERRKHLADLTDEQLKERFWELVEQVVDPITELAKKNTTPSIERSVLLRMGFSSVETMSLVEGALDRGLISHGVGHIVYRMAKDNNLEIRDAGLKLIDGELWDQAIAVFKGGDK